MTSDTYIKAIEKKLETYKKLSHDYLDEKEKLLKENFELKSEIEYLKIEIDQLDRIVDRHHRHGIDEVEALKREVNHWRSAYNVLVDKIIEHKGATPTPTTQITLPKAMDNDERTHVIASLIELIEAAQQAHPEDIFTDGVVDKMSDILDPWCTNEYRNYN